MRRNRPLVAIALACLLVFAGCAGAGNNTVAPDEQRADLGGGGGDFERATGTPAEGDDSASQGSDRLRVYTAELTVRVSAFDASRSNLSAAVDANGGYVGSSRVSATERGNETYRDGQFTYRVPAENYSAFLDAVRAEGTVVTESENVDDVTGQHADLEARLANLRAERDRLRELYEQANDTEDVLAVQERLSDVQGEIERTEARLEALENRIAYATVTVELREERPDDAPAGDHWYDTGVVAAFLDSVDGAIVALRALVVGIAYALPYLIAFGVPMAALGLLFRRFVVGNGAESGDSPADPDAESDADDEATTDESDG